MLVALAIGAMIAVAMPVGAFAADGTHGTLSGFVQRADDNGLVTAYGNGSVRVERPDGTLVASPVVGSTGAWTVDVAPGTYIVEYGSRDPSLQGYVLPAFYNGADSADAATRIALAAGQTVTHVDGTIRLGGRLTMRPVFSPQPGAPQQTADPPPDTAYSFYRLNGSSDDYDPVPTPGLTATSNGGVITSAMPRGDYVIDVATVWSDPADTSGDAPQLLFSGEADVHVASGATADAGDVVLQTDYYEQIPVYRFWSPVYQGHFYTADQAEKDSVIANLSSVWTYEGIAYWAFDQQIPGTIPLYRFWSAEYHGHFYTADANEAQTVMATLPDLWHYEGVAYYVDPPNAQYVDSTPVYRFWSPLVHHHFYTADPAERDSVIANLSSVWSYEGIAFGVPVH